MSNESKEQIRQDVRPRHSVAAILAPIIGADRDKVVLATAIEAARIFDAQVRALFIHPDSRRAVPYFGEPLSPGVEEEIVRAVRKGIDVGRKRARASVEEAVAASGIRLVETRRAVTSSSLVFQEVVGDLPKALLGASRFSDLIVFGPTVTQDWPDIRSAFAEIVLHSHRPVLTAPVVPGQLTGRIAIAWDGSIPAASAVMAAVPFLKQAGAVEILSVRDAPAARTDFSGIENYLAVHGIANVGRVIARGGHSTAETLLDAACGADLLVMGAYGHSRMRETILGGVSWHIAWHATLPVLMMH